MYRLIEPPTDGEPQRGNTTSTRRYAPSRPASPDDDTDDYETYTPIPVRRRTTAAQPQTQRLQRQPEPQSRPARGDVQQDYYDDVHDSNDDYDTPVRRRDTEPRRIVESTAPRHLVARPVQQRPVTGPLLSRRAFGGFMSDVLKTAGYGLAVMVPVAYASSMGIKKMALNQSKEKGLANVVTNLVCGHGDDSAHPTILQASLYEDGTIGFYEMPGGNRRKTEISQTASIRQGYAGDLANVDLVIIPQKVSPTKYRIRLRMTIVQYIEAPFVHDYVFEDHGKGYFEAVNPAV